MRNHTLAIQCSLHDGQYCESTVQWSSMLTLDPKVLGSFSSVVLEL